MKRHFLRNTLACLLLLALLGHTLSLYKIGFINHLDAMIYDTEVRLTLSQSQDKRIAIVDIDEKSLAELGRWPWSRDRMANLVNKLFNQYHIGLLGFDVVFAEKEAHVGRPDYDARFAHSLKGRPVILGYYFSAYSKSMATGALPPPLFSQTKRFEERGNTVSHWLGYGGNLPLFQEAAQGAGHFNPLPDFDGVSRRVPLLAEYKGNHYEALSLAMVRTLLRAPSITLGPVALDTAVEWLGVKDLRIPVDENVAALIPYRGYQGSFPYYSAADVLAGRVNVADLQDKIVLVGTTAPGLLDLRATPVGASYPGVEVHANLIAGMLDSTIKARPQYLQGAEVIMLLVLGGMMIFVFRWHSPLRATLASLGILSLVLGINFILWQFFGLVMYLASCLMLLSGLFVLNMSYGYFVEFRAKRQFADLFGQYVPPELVEEMSRDPSSYSMTGRKAELTVLFSDIRDFTSLSETMEADQLAALINEYLTAMTLVIRRHRGTLDKYIGDAIMAFWGAPIQDAEHARHAILAAMDMQLALIELNRSFAAKAWPELKMGIGINTGEMTVGDMGSQVRRAYTVMGDAVNVASRLEGLTKQYGVDIIVGEASTRAVGAVSTVSTTAITDDIAFRELGSAQVKGKAIPIIIFEPIKNESQNTRV